MTIRRGHLDDAASVLVNLNGRPFSQRVLPAFQQPETEDYVNRLLARSPLAFWRLEQITGLEASIGTELESFNMNGGTLVPSIVPTAPSSQQCVYYANGGEYAQQFDSFGGVLPAFTLQYWFSPHASRTTEENEVGSTGLGFRVGQNADGKLAVTAESAEIFTGADVIANGSVNMVSVAYTASGGGLTSIYRNGTFLGSVAGTRFFGDSVMLVGVSTENGTFQYVSVETTENAADTIAGDYAAGIGT
jgi:hypothetical protein